LLYSANSTRDTGRLTGSAVGSCRVGLELNQPGLVKMGLRIPGDSLNGTATEMSNQATKVQEACAAAGTHA